MGDLNNYLKTNGMKNHAESSKKPFLSGRSRSTSSIPSNFSSKLSTPLKIILCLCCFIAFLNFKPSEPYLTQFLLCFADEQSDFCSDYTSSTSCTEEEPCFWDNSQSSCEIIPCSNVTYSSCGSDSFDYCYQDHSSHICQDTTCYKHFTTSQINNEIYPFSTYAYLPFLLLLGPYAELFSYRIAILVGILGRVATRLLLLFGTTLYQMQLMQVTYSLGTAAEDGKKAIFSCFLPSLLSRFCFCFILHLPLRLFCLFTSVLCLYLPYCRC
jgi:hypothetical protein